MGKGEGILGVVDLGSDLGWPWKLGSSEVHSTGGIGSLSGNIREL